MVSIDVESFALQQESINIEFYLNDNEYHNEDFDKEELKVFAYDKNYIGIQSFSYSDYDGVSVEKEQWISFDLFCSELNERIVREFLKWKLKT